MKVNVGDISIKTEVVASSSQASTGPDYEKLLREQEQQFIEWAKQYIDEQLQQQLDKNSW